VDIRRCGLRACERGVGGRGQVELEVEVQRLSFRKTLRNEQSCTGHRPRNFGPGAGKPSCFGGESTTLPRFTFTDENRKTGWNLQLMRSGNIEVVSGES